MADQNLKDLTARWISSFYKTSLSEEEFEEGKKFIELSLSAQRWSFANNSTRDLLFQTSSYILNKGSHTQDEKKIIDIEKIPATKLREIDRLWREYSNGRFGFSVQKAIYYRRGSYNYQQFIADVGWYKSGSWLSPSFEETAPKGHLPYCGYSFWQPDSFPISPIALRFLGSSHQSHLSHAHPHLPHRHSQDGDAAGAAAGAGLLGLLSPAAPVILGAAAAAGVGYLIYHVATKDERERKERLEQEERNKRLEQEERNRIAAQQEAQRQLEKNQNIQKNIETLLSLI